jgi:hypothetical protein
LNNKKDGYFYQSQNLSFLGAMEADLIRKEAGFGL